MAGLFAWQGVLAHRVSILANRPCQVLTQPPHPRQQRGWLYAAARRQLTLKPLATVASGAGVAPPELLPAVHDPWRPVGQKAPRSSSAGRGGGSGGGGGGGAQWQGPHAQGYRGQALGHRLQLQQLMRRCRSAEELHGLLLGALTEATAADVAFAWHLAASRGFFGAGAGAGTDSARGEGESGGAPSAGEQEPAPGPAALRLHKLLVQLAERNVEAMGPVGLSTTAWACAASQLPSEGLLELISQHAERRLYNFRPRELCALLWACALGAPRDLRLLRLCAKLLEQGMSLELFSPHDLSVLVWCCGKVHFGPPELLDVATRECTARAATFDPPSAARLVHGFALLRHRPPGLLGPLGRRCLECMDHFCAHDLSLLVSSLGKLLCEPDLPFFQAAAARAGALVPESRPEHLTNLVWGFARLGYPPSAGRFLSRLCSHVRSNAAEYGGELLASVVWALAKLNYAPPASMLDQVLAYLFREMARQSPAALACTLWGFGIMSSSSSRVAKSHGAHFRAFAVEALGQFSAGAGGGTRELSADDMPSVLIALATLQVSPPEPLAASLAEGCSRVAGSLPGDALARLAWATATLQLRDPKLMQAIVEAPAACRLLPNGIAQLSWSLAALGCHPPELLRAMARSVAETVVSVLDPIAPLDKARIAWAYAQLGEYHPQLMDRLSGSLRAAEVHKMGPTGVAALLWACARLQHPPGAAALDLLSSYVGANVDRFSQMQLLQLGWALMRLGCRDAATLSAIALSFQGGQSGEAGAGYEGGALQASPPLEAPREEGQSRPVA